MPTIKNDRFLRALKRQTVDKTPVWLMRQAGRYLPEYRELRATVNGFMALCQNPELACEVTLQPLRRFDLDAAILFSDILTIPDAMGLGLHFVEGEGPRFDRPLRSRADIEALGRPCPEEDLGYVTAAVRLIKQSLAGELPLIGFAGSPWTLATYMVEGSGSKQFERIRGLRYTEPSLLEQLLTVLSDAVADYLNAQIAAGVDAVMLFDTWGGLLSTPDYQQFSLAFMQRVIEQLPSTTPRIIFTKGGGQWLEAMADTGVDALGLDWTTPMAEARRRVGGRVALQGNLDPAALLGTPAMVQSQVSAIRRGFGDGPGLIFNLGHGITPSVDPEQVRVLVDAVHAPLHTAVETP